MTWLCGLPHLVCVGQAVPSLMLSCFCPSGIHQRARPGPPVVVDEQLVAGADQEVLPKWQHGSPRSCEVWPEGG